jgi:hypothetical protein
MARSLSLINQALRRPHGQRLSRDRRGLIVFALFGLLLVAQAVLVIHSIDHAGKAASIDCALCLAADHPSAPAAQILPLIAVLTAEPSWSDSRTLPVSVTFTPYHSRAPPKPCFS